MRRILAFAVLLGLVGGVAWLARQATRPAEFPGGAADTAIVIVQNGLQTVVEPKGSVPLVLVFFHSDCPACLEQLRMLDADAELLQGVRLYLVTDEDSLEPGAFATRWPRLTASGVATYGVTRREDVRDRFGVVFTPTILVFDTSGHRRAKLVGQRTVAAILAEVRGEDGPGSHAP